MKEFENKVVVITGGGSGIGAATAMAFAIKGAKLIIGEINHDNANAIQSSLDKLGVDYKISISDVAKNNDVKKLMAMAVAVYGRIDIVVNNAGVANKELVKTADHTLEEWDRIIQINQTGVFYCMKSALQIMAKQGFGNIVNVASLAGLKASGNNLAYSASKFAVVGMTKSAALEYAAENIRINCVCPSYTNTALLENVLEENERMREKLLKYIPMRRYGEADEIAQAILWLASEKTSYVTGQSITLDGGLSL